MNRKIKKILIANRGEIACRIIKTARKMNIKTVMVYSDADQHTPAVKMADEKIHIGAPPAMESYLDMDKIIDACKQTNADAVHPGYGFLSERAEFAEKLEQNNIIFIAPPAKAIAAMGDKITSKKIAADAKVSTVPGFLGVIETTDEARKIAQDIGYPVMIKASAGGGGKGMRIAYHDDELEQAFISSANEARNSFGDDRLFIEKFIEEPRHIEIQILGDQHGHVIHLNERECSIQRRNQKVIEEAPSPFLDEKTRQAMGQQSTALAKEVGYFSAGTVEFIVDKDRNFYFLEMNTRLQVEHPVTELIHDIDLVEWMIRIAQGEKLTLQQKDININGWAIESRIYAEDPFRGFLPSTGRLRRYLPPIEGKDGLQGIIRNDTGVEDGGDISIYYDPMIAKLCSWNHNRKSAINSQAKALDAFIIDGIGHNIPFLSAVMAHDKFIAGDISTAFIAQEYGESFDGRDLPQKDIDAIICSATLAYYINEKRLNHNHQASYILQFGENNIEISVKKHKNNDYCLHYQGNDIDARFQWTPNDLMAYYQENDQQYTIKLRMISHGIFAIEYRGAIINIRVYPQHIAHLLQYMPPLSNDIGQDGLLCPMPGLLVKLHVGEGDIVEQGQPLATVEAMKMENILRANHRHKIKKICFNEADILMVDDVIMEFSDIDED